MSFTDRSLLNRFAFAEQRPVWVHRREQPKALAACSNAVEGIRLCVGAGGEVWIDRAPVAELTFQLLSEDLLDAWHDGRAFQVLGSTGSVYTYRTGFEAPPQVTTPPFRVSKVGRFGSTLIALAGQGLHRSDDVGASWQRLASEPQLPIDLAVDPFGHIAVLEIPERLWQSTDGGLHFIPIRRARQGVTALTVEQQRLCSVSLLAGKAVLLPQLTESVTELPSPRLTHPPADYLRASDFIERHAVDAGTHFVVARSTSEGWQLRRGGLGAPLDAPSPAVGLESCQRLVLAGGGQELWALCSTNADLDIAQPITLYISARPGRTFLRTNAELVGSPGDLRTATAVSSPGLLVSGICLPEKPKTLEVATPSRQAGCRPQGIFRIERVSGRDTSEAARVSLRLLPTPALSTSARALAATPDGKGIVAVAQRTKTNGYVLLISKDGGRTVSAPSLAGVMGEENFHALRKHTGAAIPSEVESLAIAKDGIISLVSKRGDQPRLQVFDPDGVLLSAAIPPPGVSRLGVFEDQALALSVTDHVLYESLDRGANFEPIVEQLAMPCPTANACSVVCLKAGCLIGDRLTRLQYGARTLPRLGRSPSLLYRDEPAKTSNPPTLGHCQLLSNEWQSFLGSGPLPSASSASFGGLAFYWLGIPNDEATVMLAEVMRHQPALHFKKLFPAKISAQGSAVALQLQPHGWTAARIKRLGSASDAVGTIDFAWANLPEGQRAITEFHSTELVGSLTIEHLPQGPRRWAPAMLSPLDDALYVQLSTATTNGETNAWLVSTTHTPRAIHFAGWRGQTVVNEAVTGTAGQPVTMALVGQGMVLLRNDASTMATSATTIAPSPTSTGEAIELSGFAQLGHRAGVLISVPLARGPGTSQRFFPFVGSEAAVGPSTTIPRIFAPGSQLPGCTSARRSDAERIVVPLAARERISWTVNGNDEATSTLSARRVVLYLNAGGTCWDVVEAADAANAVSALIFADPAERSWIFRNGRDLLGNATLESGMLQCQSDAAIGPQAPASE